MMSPPVIWIASIVGLGPTASAPLKVFDIRWAGRSTTAPKRPPNRPRKACFMLLSSSSGFKHPSTLPVRVKICLLTYIKRMEDQEKAGHFIEEHDLGGDASVWIHDLQSELGEVSKELLKASDYGEKGAEFSEDMEEEIGDLYFSLLGLADQLGIDLSSSLDAVLEKYQERAESSGNPGSRG